MKHRDRTGNQPALGSKLVVGQDRVRDEDQRDLGAFDGWERSARKTGLDERASYVRARKERDARGGSHVHAKWLQDHKGDEARCRLVTTQLVTCDRCHTQCTTTDVGKILVDDCFAGC